MGRSPWNRGGGFLARDALPVGPGGQDAGGETLAVAATLPSLRATPETRRAAQVPPRPSPSTTNRVPSEPPQTDVVDARRRHWMQGVPPILPPHTGGDRGDIHPLWEELPGTSTLATWRGARDPSGPAPAWFHEQWSRARLGLEALSQIGSVARSLACDAIAPIKACQSLVDMVFRTIGRDASVTMLPVVELDLALLAGDRFGAGPWGEHLFALETALTFRVALERDGRWSCERNAVLTGLLLQNLGREFVARDIPPRGLDHARSGAATLTGLAGLSLSIAPVVAYHHSHPAPVFRGGDRGGLRTPLLARGAAAIVRLLELEHMLRPLGRRIGSVRDAALEQLVRESVGLSADRYWVDLLHRTLKGTAARESAVTQFPSLAALVPVSSDDQSRLTSRIDPAESFPVAPHAAISDPARELRRVALSPQQTLESSVSHGKGER